MNNKTTRIPEAIGILIALATLVVAVLTWLVPFNPVGPSPLLPRETAQVSIPAPTVVQRGSPLPSAKPTATATYSGQATACLGTELIAFSSGRDGNDEIYVMNVDGSCVTRLTNNPASDLSPAWSPDGKRIAFTSNRDRNATNHYAEQFEIYVMNSDGTDVTRLTFSGGNASPAWSPDGQRIAYIHSDPYTGQSIQITNLNSSSTIRLSASVKSDYLIPEYSPAWSPDGRQIAFVSDLDGCQWGIYVMRADGTDVKRLTSACVGKYSGPAWSPDSQHIAFGNNANDWWQVYIMNVDGSNVRRVTTSPRAFDARLHPTWSPDGRFIAFVKGNNERHHICVIAIGDSAEKCLTEPRMVQGGDMYPSWSPAP